VVGLDRQGGLAMHEDVGEGFGAPAGVGRAVGLHLQPG